MPPSAPVLLPLPPGDADIDGLADLLLDAVDSNAAVSFIVPLPLATARDWWRTTLSSLPPKGGLFVARDDGGLCGCVGLFPAWAPNQPHRAEIGKLIVHRRARGRGLAAQLMHAAESHARRAGFTLLTLDAKSGGTADRLYHRLGWTFVGTIPGYAVDTDGRTLHDDALFYKPL